MKPAPHAIAALLATAIVTLVIREAQGAWLPTSLGVVITLLVFTAPLYRKIELLSPLAMSLIGLADIGWLASEPRTHIHHPIVLMGVSGLLFSVGFCLLIVTKEGRQLLTTAFLMVGVPVGLVSYFSTSTGSAGRMLKFFITELHMSPELAQHSIVLVRKSIHFSFYGTVALACCIALKRGKQSLGGATFFGLLMALSLASFDEYRQSMTSDRTGQWQDVALDMAGALSFLTIYYVLSKSRNTRANM